MAAYQPKEIENMARVKKTLAQNGKLVSTTRVNMLKKKAQTLGLVNIGPERFHTVLTTE